METEQTATFVSDLLKVLIARGGSDLFLTADFPPALKIDGKVVKIAQQALTAAHSRALARALMNDRQATNFERDKECNFAISPTGLGRFRVNAFIQQGKVGVVVRKINTKLPTVESMGLPNVLKDVVMNKLGLIMMVGSTGSGKSTSIAAMLDYRNENSSGHIITIEDPLEFIHPHKNCIVTHREIGQDTDDWENALKNSLRQAPDVILMGEIRDREAMEMAIMFSETGHLCLATLHANNAYTAFDRMINFFPPDRREQTFSDLSLNVRSIISQRLVPHASGKGRVAAVEVLLNTPTVSELIQKGEFGEIHEVMKRSHNIGMQTFDQALFDLYEEEKIDLDDALRNADSANDLRLMIKLNSKRSGQIDLSEGTEKLRIL